MNKIWIIVQREYITRVKRRAFVITTLLAPLGFLLLIGTSVIISIYSQGRTDVAIVDDTGLFKDIPIPDADDQTVYFHKVDDRYEHVVKQMPKDKEKEAKYQAIIYIPPNFDINSPDKPEIAYRSRQRAGLSKQEFINQRMSAAVQKLRMKLQHNISNNDLERIQKEVTVHFEPLDNSQESQEYTNVAAGVGIVMGFAIYISLFFYGTMIMKGVMEEKTNRIIELLTSSVKPFQLLMGKILGIGAVGLTQFILWILLTFIVQLFMSHYEPTVSKLHSNALDLDKIEQIKLAITALPIVQIVIFFPLYFLGGFLLYGSLYAAVGAAMGEDGDQQSLMIPITVPIIISIFIAINVINNPDSNLGFWGSIIPLTSPVVMCALLPFRPEWWQVAISLLFLAGGFVFTAWIAGRIYRVGILMYGKKATLKEMGRWIFAKA